MNGKKTLSGLVTVGMLLGGTIAAYGEETSREVSPTSTTQFLPHTYPGSLCKQVGKPGESDVIYQNGTAEYAGNREFEVVTCPISNHGSWRYIHVEANVYSGSTDYVHCELHSQDQFGQNDDFHWESARRIRYDTLRMLVNANYMHYMTCELPRRGSRGNSSVISYRVY